MCGYSAGSHLVRQRTRDDIARERALYAFEVERAQQRFDELDRELREWDKPRDAALSAEPVEVKP